MKTNRISRQTRLKFFFKCQQIRWKTNRNQTKNSNKAEDLKKTLREKNKDEKITTTIQ